MKQKLNNCYITTLLGIVNFKIQTWKMTLFGPCLKCILLMRLTAACTFPYKSKKRHVYLLTKMTENWRLYGMELCHFLIIFNIPNTRYFKNDKMVIAENRISYIDTTFLFSFPMKFNFNWRQRILAAAYSCGERPSLIPGGQYFTFLNSFRLGIELIHVPIRPNQLSIKEFCFRLWKPHQEVRWEVN